MRKRKLIKRFMSFFLLLVLLLCVKTSFTVQGTDTNKAFSWYVQRNKNHEQPTVSMQGDYEKYDAYYIDQKHADASSEKVVYLTFDAGYENGNICKILDVLREERVPAAFFILKNMVLKESVLLERMVNEGHMVCNHTLNHTDLTSATREEIEAEINGLATLYQEKTGKTISFYFRPPEGKYNEETLRCAQALGYKTVFWSFAYADWDNDKQPDIESAKKKVLENMHNGAVILLHPTSTTNAKIMRDLIQHWKAEGYRFGTLDELVKKQ